MASPPGGATDLNAALPRRGHRRPDESIGGGKNATAICRRTPSDNPEYISWRDEGCRLMQLSPRQYVAAAVGAGTDGGNCCSGMKVNTYYQELVRQKLDQQRAENERQQMKIINDNRTCIFRSGGKGAPWRQLKLTTGASGENVMFIDGDVKRQDMMKFYPAESGNDDERRIVRGPPRPLPHFYVGNVTLDPNKTAAELKERKNDKRRPPDGVKTPRSRRENSQPKDHVAKRPNDDKM